jgi:pyruvate dehydrogenase E2 component (dihydrolipoamide acetyltransferase)
MSDVKRIKESYKLKGTRKFIAVKMAESLKNYPQASGSMYICTDALFELKSELSKKDANVSITSLLTKLCAEALKKHPALNSALIDDEFFIYDSINIGVGIGLEEGIMIVVINEVQDKNIFQVSAELQDYIARLKAKTLPLSAMQGSTFTLSNMGMLGIEQSTPILNAPETLIVGVGLTRKQLVVNDDDTTSIKRMTCFSTTINHAAIDGLHGGLFTLTLRDYLQDPGAHMGL